MKWFKDIHNREIRLTDERRKHIESDHPEMSGQISRIQETLLNPAVIIRSRTDEYVEMFYRYYSLTPTIGGKYLCVVVKVLGVDLFIITAYFTDTVKRGEVLWQKK